MANLFQSVGGRKLVLTFSTMLLVVLNSVLKLGIDSESLWALVVASVGGSSAIAIEDALRKKASGK